MFSAVKYPLLLAPFLFLLSPSMHLSAINVLYLKFLILFLYSNWNTSLYWKLCAHWRVHFWVVCVNLFRTKRPRLLVSKAKQMDLLFETCFICHLSCAFCLFFCFPLFDSRHWILSLVPKTGLY